MRFFRAKLGLWLLVLFSVCSRAHFSDQKLSNYHWTDTGLLELKPQVVNVAKEDFEILILFVYGSWCPSAQGKLHVFEDIAMQHQIIKSRLTFGVLDVKHLEDIGDLGVMEVPGMLLFVKGSAFHLNWEEDADSDALALQIEAVLKPYLLPSISETEFKKLQLLPNYSFAVFHGTPNEEGYWDFYKTAENHFEQSVQFYLVQPSNDKSDLELPKGISFCNQNCQPFKADDLNVFTLYDWISKKAMNAGPQVADVESFKLLKYNEPLLVKSALNRYCSMINLKRARLLFKNSS
jgi:hypothetical protein